MAGSIKLDTRKQVLENSYDGKIFIKYNDTWHHTDNVLHRGNTQPTNAKTNDIWLSEQPNNIQLYKYNGSTWSVINQNVYFTEEPMVDADGGNGDYNVLSGIISVGPIVRLGDKSTIKDETDYPYIYINETDKSLHVTEDFGDYRVNYDGEIPNKSNSMANALITDTTLYPPLEWRKTINH